MKLFAIDVVALINNQQCSVNSCCAQKESDLSGISES